MPQGKTAKQIDTAIPDEPPAYDKDWDTDWEEAHRDAIEAGIRQAIEENDYKPLTEEDFARWRRIARGEE